MEENIDNLELSKNQKKKYEKVEKWIKSLNPNKQNELQLYINLKAKEMLKKGEENGIDLILDTAVSTISGVLSYQFPFVTEEKIEKCLISFQDFFEENMHFVNEEGALWKQKLLNIEPKALEFIRGIIKEDITREEVEKKVKEKFSNLTRGQIYNGIKVIEEELRNKGEEVKMSTEEAVEYILEEEPEENNNLKVIEKKLKIQGAFGQYEVNNEVVKVNDKTFNSLEEVEKYKKEQIKKITDSSEEIKKVFNLI